MADDPTEEEPATGDEPNEDTDGAEDLGDAGKKALDRERKARRDAEKQLSDLQTRLKEIEDKDKGEVEKLREENAQLEKDLADVRAQKLRLEVAAEKGVKPRWLTGSTREEIEQAADEYLEDHPPAEGATPPPSRRPNPDLKGGTDPNDEPSETDPAKLAESVPRF